MSRWEEGGGTQKGWGILAKCESLEVAQTREQGVVVVLGPLAPRGLLWGVGSASPWVPPRRRARLRPPSARGGGGRRGGRLSVRGGGGAAAGAGLVVGAVRRLAAGLGVLLRVGAGLCGGRFVVAAGGGGCGGGGFRRGGVVRRFGSVAVPVGCVRLRVRCRLVGFGGVLVGAAAGWASCALACGGAVRVRCFLVALLRVAAFLAVALGFVACLLRLCGVGGLVGRGLVLRFGLPPALGGGARRGAAPQKSTAERAAQCDRLSQSRRRRAGVGRASGGRGSAGKRARTPAFDGCIRTPSFDGCIRTPSFGVCDQSRRLHNATPHHIAPVAQVWSNGATRFRPKR